MARGMQPLGFAAALLASASLATPAFGQAPFTDYRQAAADQYSVTGSSGPPATASGQSSAPKPTAASTTKDTHCSTPARTRARAAQSATCPSPGTGNGTGSGERPGETGGGKHRPIAVSAPVDVSGRIGGGGGSLPFTGLGVGAVVLLGLALIALGCAAAAVDRLRRRRARLAT